MNTGEAVTLTPALSPQGRGSFLDRIWVVIPVYNNATTVKEVALGCRAELPHVLVVDDGSTDGDIAGMFGGTDIVVMRHAINQGKGKAILTALATVREQGGDIMITVDADGQHHPSDIRKFLPVLAEDPTAIVIGARNMESPNVPSSSRFGMRFSDFWLRLETGVRMTDTQSGFRAYPVKALSELEFDSGRYDFEVEVLARAAWAGLTIKSIGVEVTYLEKGKRISHFRPFWDNLRLTHRHVLLVLRRLNPWPHRQLVAREPDEMAQFFRHPVRVFRHLLLEHATPAELGMAAAVGVFLATLPLLSCHTAVILYVATRFKLNRLMALSIQNLCMPPVVPFLCVELGYFMRHGEWLKAMTRETWIYQAPQRVWEWFLGSLIAAPILAIVTGMVVWAIVNLINRRKIQ
jgi:glycosyltransferase involved in cell wall biosynthesis